MKETDEVHYNLPPIDWSTQYLTFETLESGTFKVSRNAIIYSLDDGKTWVSLASDTNTPVIEAGKRIMFKANISPSINFGIGTFSATNRFNAYGNPYSLIYGDSFINKPSSAGAFAGMFRGCIYLVSAKNISLPSTTADNCYTSMFYGCTSLTEAPQLPATTLATYCYSNMFEGCTSLTTAPEIPATTLASYCCISMFKGCTSLTTAPSVLPATTLAGFCYGGGSEQGSSRGMFQNCTSLEIGPSLPAETLAQYCYNNMFRGCSSLKYLEMFATDISAENCLTDWVYGVTSTGTFVKNPSMPSLPSGSSGIPEGWTVQDA